MVLTMAAVAANKSITPDKLQVQVETRIEEEAGHEQRTTFVTVIDLGSGLTERERKILFNSARHCEVHRLLRGAIEFRETFVSDQQTVISNQNTDHWLLIGQSSHRK